MSYTTKEIRPFNPDVTFNSGQCFRWEKHDNQWHGIVQGRFAKICGSYPNVFITCKKVDLNFWENYFDSSYDYEKAHDNLLKDKRLSCAVRNNRGLIFLKQPFFETLISFIISANNNIPRIKSIISNISKEYGEKIEEGYSFPKPDKLASLREVELLAQGCGYRSRYIIETSKAIIDGYSHDRLRYMELDDARNELCEFMGVGKKVADCILIFSLARKDAFPVDTWVRKASINLFGSKFNDNEIRALAYERFGNDSALAQQYMFIAERES
jgi:N-glycosylase/DNA lyase